MANSALGLASVYVRQGRFTDAESLFKRALAIYEKALGPDHPWIANCLVGLATIYTRQGRYHEAELLLTACDCPLRKFIWKGSLRGRPAR